MKIVYIAHPIKGDVQGNLKKIEAIGRQINLGEPDTIPFAHYYFDCSTLDDNVPEERERGIRNGLELIRRGFINELRLYGPRISQGMIREIIAAIQQGIPVVAMTIGTKRNLVNMGILKCPDATGCFALHTNFCTSSCLNYELEIPEGEENHG